MHPLVRRQLRKAFPDGVPATPEVAALAEAIGDAYRAAEDDRAQLERSLELASHELVARNQAMTLILDTVAQGLVTVGLDGALGTPCSRALTAWFGAPAADARRWSYLCGHDANLEAWIALGFDSLREARMPAEVVLVQLPGLIEREGQHAQLAEAIAQALAAQADAANQQGAQPPQGGGGPTPQALGQAATEVRNALGSMQDASTTLTQARDQAQQMSVDIGPALAAQQTAIDHLEAALRLLQPPQQQQDQKNDQQDQQDQQQQDQQQKDQQQQSAEQQLQQVREREAQRERDKREREQQAGGNDPVDKDW